MRISKPFQLLEALKPHLKSSDIAQIDRYRQTLKNKIMRFTKSLPVYTTYFTVFKRDGMVFFRKDIYGYDKMIQDATVKDDSYMDREESSILNEEYSVY